MPEPFVTVSFKLSPEEKAQLESAVKTLDTDQSKLIRQALRSSGVLQFEGVLPRPADAQRVPVVTVREA